MCVLSIKVPIRKESGNLSYVPRIFKKNIDKWLDCFSFLSRYNMYEMLLSKYVH